MVDGRLAMNATQIRNESTRAAALRGAIASVTAPDTITVTVPKGATRTVKVTANTVIKTDQTKLKIPSPEGVLVYH